MSEEKKTTEEESTEMEEIMSEEESTGKGKKGKKASPKKQTTEEEKIMTEEESTSKKGKPRKSYPILTKTEIGEIITRKINGEKVNISKNYKQSKQTEGKINALLNKSWRKTTENDAVPNGFFNPNSVQKKVISVMFDKGYVLN